MKNKAVIVDVDNTIADIKHRLHYIRNDAGKKDWKTFHSREELLKDVPFTEVIECVNLLSQKYPILIVTGRTYETLDTTKEWLDTQGVTYEEVYLRTQNDYRDDDIIKEEILHQIRAEGYDPFLVFDDRDRVVAMWRRNGLRCFQVNPGTF